MKKRVMPLCLGAACLSAALCLAGCDFFVASWNALRVWTPWARSATDAVNQSDFFGAAAFDSDTIYVAGDIVGAAQFVFGPEAAARGDYAGFNAVLVKYDGSGAAQWARSTVDADDESRFYAAAVDAAGNVYAAGYIRGNGTFSFGPDADVIGNLPGDWNAVLVKYGPDGTARWARSVDSAPLESLYYGVAADAAGNAYAVGCIYGNGTYDFGGVSAHGAVADDGVTAAVIVKYGPDGTPRWARSVTVAVDNSRFDAVCVDESGNAYAAGYIVGDDGNSFGVDVMGDFPGARNAVLVKYNAGGTAQWARSVETGWGDSHFYGVDADSAGNLYAAGNIMGNGLYTFAPDVDVFGDYDAGTNAVIIKYDGDGNPLWGRSTTRASANTNFLGVSVNSAGEVFAAGYLVGSDEFEFDDTAGTRGAYSFSNVLLVKCGGGGAAQWARTVTAASNESEYRAIAADASGNALCAGRILGTDEFVFAAGAAVSGVDAGYNGVVVKNLNE
jgi:hypothetical protein